MVSFSCEGCGDVLTKKKLDPHRGQCRGASYTCLDCMVHFVGNDYRSHTSCISEAQKYQGHLYREKAGKGKGKGQGKGQGQSQVQGQSQGGAGVDVKSGAGETTADTANATVAVIPARDGTAIAPVPEPVGGAAKRKRDDESDHRRPPPPPPHENDTGTTRSAQETTDRKIKRGRKDMNAKQSETTGTETNEGGTNGTISAEITPEHSAEGNLFMSILGKQLKSRDDTKMSKVLEKWNKKRQQCEGGVTELCDKLIIRKNAAGEFVLRAL